MIYPILILKKPKLIHHQHPLFLMNFNRISIIYVLLKIPQVFLKPMKNPMVFIDNYLTMFKYIISFLFTLFFSKSLLKARYCYTYIFVVIDFVFFSFLVITYRYTIERKKKKENRSSLIRHCHQIIDRVNLKRKMMLKNSK
jgi:hypothetical protein